MEEAQEKLRLLLDLASSDEKEQLRQELSKMMPTENNAEVSAKIGWGHYDKSVHASMNFFVKSYNNATENTSLAELYSKLIERMNPNEQSRLLESFEALLSQKPRKVKLGNLPSMEIAHQTRAISTSFEIAV